MLLFLDIDGVLRRETSPLFVFDPDCRDALEEAVRSISDLRIVISSAWRTGFTLEEIRSHFSLDVAALIVDATPVLPPEAEHVRHLEVLQYLRDHDPEEPWIAIDDDPLNYPLGCPLLRIDPSFGFSPADAERLRTGALHVVRRIGG